MAAKTTAQRARPRPRQYTCRRVTSLISDYLVGELDPTRLAAFEAHILDCRDCVAFLNTYLKTVGATRALRYAALPSELQERALEVLRRKIKSTPRRR